MLRFRGIILSLAGICVLFSLLIASSMRCAAQSSPAIKLLTTFLAPNDGKAPDASLFKAHSGIFFGTTNEGGTYGGGTLFKLTPSGTLTTLHSFTGAGGTTPYGVIVGTDGRLYGTTASGGAKNHGTIYSVNQDGSNFVTLHSLVSTDGNFPQSPLLQASNGKLMGTAFSGGSASYGTLFSINTDGTGFTILHPFDQQDEVPVGSVIEGSDGRLYGTTDNYVFAINLDGSGYTTLDPLSTPAAGPVIQGSDGRLYGTVTTDDPQAPAAVYALNTDGSDFVTLYSANTELGGGLVQGPDDRLYGTVTAGDGGIFALTTAGTGFTRLFTFNFTDGAYPAGSLAEGNDGRLYGVTGGGDGPDSAGTAYAVKIDGSGFTILHGFRDGSRGPQNPRSPLTQTPSGNLYGTTSSGGANSLGTLYQLTLAGKVSVVHSFNGTDGAHPSTHLISGKDHRLYGAAGGGPQWQSDPNETYGIIFAIKTNGSDLVTLHAFNSNDGNGPTDVIQGADGRIYGTTSNGGSNYDGTVFAMNPDGTGFVTLYTFGTNGASGIYPYATVVQGKDGRLYGATNRGASSDVGTLYALNTDGMGFTVLHTFDYTDGGEVRAPLIQGRDGRLYGASQAGSGLIFAVDTDGSGYAILYSFAANSRESAEGPLIQGPDARLYLTSSGGGEYGGGEVYSLNPDGSGFTTLYGFDHPSNAYGDGPDSGVLLGMDGNLYGTNSMGGVAPNSNTAPAGTVFALETNLPSVTSFTPFSGPVGTTVTITGNNLANATSVKLGKVSMTITNDTATQITFTIPTGAKSNAFTVTTSSGEAITERHFVVTN